MKKIIYAGSDFVTGDDIAAALLQYSAALAEVGEAETVVIPTREDDGSAGTVVVLVGPASQIIAKQVRQDDDAELVDEGFVRDIQSRMRRLHPVAAFDPDAADQVDWDQGG